ncbi:MAG: TatD family hydrolase [Clostridia bacterium]|nr:TatD family hydrolase [Clostridia bacterium]
MLFDTHAHLDDKKYNQDRQEMLARAREAGAELIVNVGYDLPSSQRSVQLARENDFIYAAVGFHPHDAKEANQEALDELRKLAGEAKVVALGEMGLDYFRDLSPRDVQKRVFREQISLAKELKLPIIIHDRDAHGDVMNILKEEGAWEVGGILHCFSGSWEMAKECINLGFYISFAGPVTFHNAARLQEVAAKVPTEWMLIETDAPYLTPEPHRGKRNESGYVAHVAAKIAEIKGLSYEEVAAITMENGKKVFGLS